MKDLPEYNLSEVPCYHSRVVRSSASRGDPHSRPTLPPTHWPSNPRQSIVALQVSVSSSTKMPCCVKVKIQRDWAMKTGTRPGKAVSQYVIAIVRGSILSPSPFTQHTYLQFLLTLCHFTCLLLSSTSGIMSSNVGDNWYLSLTADFSRGCPHVLP